MDINLFLQNLWIWMVSFLNSFVPNYVIPNLRLIIQTLVLLLVAYVIGRTAKAVTIKLLSMAGLKKVTIRTWTDDILKAIGYRGTVISLIGDLVKWLIYILFFAIIIQSFGLPGIAEIFTQIAIFMPRFIGAILIIVIGFIIADFFGKVFEEAGRRFIQEETLSSLSGGMIKYSIALISLIMALSLLGLDTLSLSILFGVVITTVVVVMIIGIRDMFPNLTAGIHLKRSLKIGERIKIGEHSGTVEKVEPLYLVLRNGKKTVLIPNSFLVKNPIEKIGRK